MDYGKAAAGFCQFVQDEIVPKILTNETAQAITWGIICIQKPRIQTQMESLFSSLGLTDRESVSTFFDACFQKTQTLRVQPKALIQKFAGVNLCGPLSDEYLGGTICLTRDDINRLLDRMFG